MEIRTDAGYIQILMQLEPSDAEILLDALEEHVLVPTQAIKDLCEGLREELFP